MAFATATIPERIRSARLLRGFSTRAFAREARTQQGNVWQWEAGKTVPRPETLLRIAETLRVNMLWLTFGEGPMEIQNENAPAGTEASLSNVAR